MPHPLKRPLPTLARLHAAGALGALMGLGACTQMDVRLISADPRQPYYELRGADLTAVALEAARLCPQGHEVLRQASRSQRLEGSGVVSRWANKLASGLESEDNRAEMTVRCKLAPAPGSPAQPSPSAPLAKV